MPKYKPNWELLRCNPCGHCWKRREPQDAALDPPICPNCQAKAGPWLDKDGEQVVNLRGEALDAIHKAYTDQDVRAWKKNFILQERQLPNQAPPTQWAKLKSRTVDLCFPNLTNFEIRLLAYFIRMQGQDGWTWPLAQTVLACSMIGRSRNTPINRTTIRRAIESMEGQFYPCWDEVRGEFVDRPLLQRSIQGKGGPARFKVNQP